MLIFSIKTWIIMSNCIASQGVKNGLITFLAEGNDSPNSIAFSRKIHHPSFDSGVTIGRGYDLKERSKALIYHDLMSAGLPTAQAKKISEASKISGHKAIIFVRQHREDIGEITRSQQVTLFNNIYPNYVKITKLRYERITSTYHGCPWNKLNFAVRDILVDIVYQGFKGHQAMKSASTNNIQDFVNFLRYNKEYLPYENGRNRVKYLERHIILRRKP